MRFAETASHHWDAAHLFVCLQSTVNTVLNENMQNIMANAREENMESTANSIHAVIRKANYLASAKERQAEKRNQARFGI